MRPGFERFSADFACLVDKNAVPPDLSALGPIGTDRTPIRRAKQSSDVKHPMSGWRRNEQEQSHGYIVWVSPLRQRTIDDIRLRKLSEQTQSYYMRWASGGRN